LLSLVLPQESFEPSLSSQINMRLYTLHMVEMLMVLMNEVEGKFSRLHFPKSNFYEIWHGFLLYIEEYLLMIAMPKGEIKYNQSSYLVRNY